MTLKLILIRHAKSDWDDPRLADHDRPLNDRGRTAARLIGNWLHDNGHLPRQALVSTATRAVETWEGMAPAFDVAKPEVSFRPRLYHAAPETMLACLNGITEACALMIGHNPGIAALAGSLVERPPKHSRFADYPTAATLVCRFSADRWSDIVRGSAQVVDFVVPRDLSD